MGVFPKSKYGSREKISLKWHKPNIVLEKINDVLYKIGENAKHKGI